MSAIVEFKTSRLGKTKIAINSDSILCVSGRDDRAILSVSKGLNAENIEIEENYEVAVALWRKALSDSRRPY